MSTIAWGSPATVAPTSTPRLVVPKVRLPPRGGAAIPSGPQVPPRPVPSGRRPGFDGVRAVAALVVVVTHCGALPGASDPLPGGFVAVDVFFVLSGFLITQSCLNELERTGSFSFRRFLARRQLRLYPALLVAVGVTAVAVELLPSMRPLRDRTLSCLPAALTWWTNLKVSSDGLGAGLYTHLWSVATEEQFYLLWPPLLAVVVGPRLLRRRSLAGAVTLLAVIEVVAGAVAAEGAPAIGRAGLVVYDSPLLHSGGLLVGSALACLTSGRPRRRPPATPWWIAVVGGVAALAVTARVVDGSTQQLVWAPAVATLACVPLLLSLMWWPRSRITRILDVAPLRWLGRRSYSLYLWNYPVVFLLAAIWKGIRTSPWSVVVVAVVSVALAEVSWLAIERPVMNLMPRLSGDRVRRPASARLERLATHPLWAWPLRLETQPIRPTR